MLFQCCLSSAHILWAQVDGSSITCGNYRTLHSNVLGEDRTLLIRLPEDYGKSDKKYPVLHKLDGEQGNFLHALSAANYLFDWKGAPDPIIVGIANTDRGRDMGPARGADNFIRFLKDELIPFIDKSYRTDGFRIVCGQSFSSMFAAYAFLKQPTLFDAYVLSSFGLYDESLGARFETELKKRDLGTVGKKYLFVANGKRDTYDPDGTITARGARFLESLRRAAPASVSIKAKDYDDEGHVPFPSIYDALRWIYSGEKAAGTTVSSSQSLRLEWTHFIGGSGRENLGWLRSPVLNRDGMLYFTGTTLSSDFPATADAVYPAYKGGSQKWGLEDVFLVKFNTRQPGIAYSTFLGGAKGPEHAADLLVDGAGDVYIAGNTGSSDFPTTEDALTRQFQGPDFRHADGFLTILGDDGRKLKYSTFIGGSMNDGVSQVFVEPSGELTLFGITESPGFPSADAVRPKGLKEGPALFVMRLDARRRRVVFARLLENSWGTDIQRLDSGDFLIAGTTANPELPAIDGLLGSPYHGGSQFWGGDILIMRLSADLKRVSFATFFVGSGEESWPKLPKVTTIAGGDFFVFGKTTSKDLPVTANALEKTMQDKEALFLARFSGDGRQLKYCTYLGGKGTGAASSARHLAYDGRSRIYIAGDTTSADFPVTPDAVQAKNHGGRDVFLLAFNIADDSLAYGSYLGGSKDDADPRLAFDQQGSLYVIGSTDSDDFPSHEANRSAR
jgi:predicted alpha/beta superfamily hydrolase